MNTVIEFLSKPILPDTVKTFSGYSDWPPVWVVVFGFVGIFFMIGFFRDMEDD